MDFPSRTLAVAFLFLTAPASAQVNTSSIAGVITDATGSVVPEATITAIQAATGLERQTRSGSGGEYVLPQLPPGRYEITAKATGFQTTVVKDVALAIAQREVVNITLTVGQVTEQVTVTAEASQLKESETASLGQLIERRVIQDLPLNGRNYLTLGSLSPGVVPQIPASQGPASFISSTTQRPDRSILVGGQRESSTSYLLDGVELRNPRVGDSSINPSLDMIEEFKIQRNFFSAEFGNSPGIINVATRAGGNQFHGSAYELVRNDRFDARNFFARTSEPFKRSQFGFSFGGPIRKDKLFAFGNYEGLRQRLGVVQRGLYPTQKLLGGDFTGEAVIHDPLTFNSTTGMRQVFAGNVVPQARVNAVSRNILPYIPVTNNPTVQGANLVGTPVQRLNDDQETVRVDWTINSRHSLFGRQTWQDAPLEPASLTPLGGAQVISKGTNEVVQLTSTLTARLVNVLRLYHSYANLFGQQVPVNEDLAGKIGITGISTVRRNWGVPNIGWQGFSGVGSNGLTQGNIINNYQIADSVAWIRNRHTIKFGAEIRQSRMFLDSDNSPRGSFTFLSSWTAALDAQSGNPVTGTGHPVAEFLLGYPTNMNGAVGTSQTHFRFYTNNFYFQDDWKLTRNLTVNYGLRYEYVSPPTAEELDHVFGFDFSTARQLFPILGQIRPSIIEPDYNNWAPRLGLAYNPAWAPSWVIRAAAGMYYDQTQMNETQFTTNSPPTFFQQNINLTGRGLPPNQFGVNALPVVPVPRIDANYRIPPNTNLFAQELNGRKPREYMWNLSLQKSLGSRWLAEAAYVGSQGRRLSKRYNSSSPAVPGELYRVVPGSNRFNPATTGIAGMLYSSQAGKSNFNALNLKLERRFGEGFSVLSSYSWSHSIDTDSGGSFGSPNLNPANFVLDKGSSDFDIRQRFVTSLIYELPVGKGKRLLGSSSRAADLIAGGWQLTSTTVFQSGVNRSVTSPNTSTIAFISQRADAAGIASNSDFTAGGSTIRPGNDFGGANSSLYWLNPNAFRRVAPLTFGTSGRDLISGPGFWNWDMSLFKSFALTEAVKLQFRAEFFNAFNNVRFNPPNMDSSSPFFGQIQSAQPPRILQFSLRIQF
ncbi:MAG: TonB-dependent receptor [Acidobacteria bacterium]|nr:TonB-dependent receptor [Acidobacteriota bacterium]